MIRTTLLTAVALAALSLLTACGGGAAGDDSVAMNSQASSVNVGGIGGSGVGAASVNVGGIGGSGVGAASVSVGGIGGSGVGTASVNVGGIGGSGAGKASVSIAHACSLQSVDVTVAGARVNANGAADLGSPGWVDVAVAAPVRVNLLALASGSALPLDLSALPDGHYGQIRLLLATNDAASPLADDVVAGGLESALSVPSAAQGGLPLAANISVASGQVSASWQGLDVCTAVAANSGTYALDAVTAGSTVVASAN